MFKELKTKRLTLKNISMDDIDFMYQQFSDDFINQYLFDAEPLANLDEAKELIEFYLNTVQYYNHRYILMNEENEKIGTIGFHNYNNDSKTVDIGYDLRKPYNHQGYMKEALETMLIYMKDALDLKYVQAVIYKDNQPSIKLVSSFGFKPHGTKIETFRNEPYEHIIYQLEMK